MENSENDFRKIEQLVQPIKLSIFRGVPSPYSKNMVFTWPTTRNVLFLAESMLSREVVKAIVVDNDQSIEALLSHINEFIGMYKQNALWIDDDGIINMNNRDFTIQILPKVFLPSEVEDILLYEYPHKGNTFTEKLENFRELILEPHVKYNESLNFLANIAPKEVFCECQNREITIINNIYDSLHKINTTMNYINSIIPIEPTRCTCRNFNTQNYVPKINDRPILFTTRVERTNSKVPRCYLPRSVTGTSFAKFALKDSKQFVEIVKKWKSAEFPWKFTDSMWKLGEQYEIQGIREVPEREEREENIDERINNFLTKITLEEDLEDSKNVSALASNCTEKISQFGFNDKY